MSADYQTTRLHRCILFTVLLLALTGMHSQSLAQDAYPPEKGRIFEGYVINKPEALYGGRHGNALAITPDSRKLIASRGNYAVVMNAADLSPLLYLKPDFSDVTALAVSPDGTLLLTGTQAGGIKLYNLSTGQLKHSLFYSSYRINDVAFSFDSKRCGIVGESTTGYIIDVSNGTTLQTFRHTWVDGTYTYYYPINSIAFAPNSYQFVTGGNDEYARIWNGASSTNLKHSFDVLSVAYRPTGSEVVTADGNTIRRWNANTGAFIATVATTANAVSQLLVTPDGNKVLTALYGSTAKLWDIETGVLLQNFQGHTAAVRSIAYAPDGARIYTASSDASLRVWGTQNSIELQRIPGHPGRANKIAISLDETKVVTVGESAALHMWDASTTLYESTIYTNQRTNGVAFRADTEQLFVTSGTNTTLWDTDLLNSSVSYLGHLASVLDIDATLNGNYLLSSSADNTAMLWEAGSGASIGTLFTDADVTSAAISDDATLAILGVNRQASLWNPLTGEMLSRLAPNNISVTDVDLSGDGEIAITGGSDGYARLYQTDLTLPLIGYNTGDSSVNAVCLSPDKQTLLTGGADGVAHIFDLESGVELARYTAHEYPVQEVRFAPTSGAWALTLGQDGLAHRWNSVPSCRKRCEDEPQDTDGDGLSDCHELCIGTEPTSPDTDEDGLDDYYEFTNYLRRDFPDADLDRDGDGLNNIDEATLGLIAYVPDTDGDGMQDGYEVEYQLDPLADDSEADLDGDGVLNIDEFGYNTSPISTDTDGDSMSDDYEIAYGLNPIITDGSLDRDRDGLSNIEEARLGLNPRTGDTDGDDMPDGFEVENGLNPFERDALRDLDGDGLSNIEELWARTDPQNGDDPPIPTYVNAATGSDTEGVGTLDKPFLTISAALLDTARYTYTNKIAATIVAQAGTYTRPVEIPENVTLSGEGSDTVLSAPRGLIEPFVKLRRNSALTHCTVTLDPQQTSGIATLVQFLEYNSRIDNVTFIGVNTRSVTAIADNGSWYSENEIQDCTFRDLATAIVTVSSNTQIARCLFENITGRGLRALGTFRREGVPSLGSITELNDTGFNRWHSDTGAFVEIEGSPRKVIDAAYNDWGVYTEDEVASRILALGNASADEIYSTPFLANPLQPGDHILLPVGTDNRPLVNNNAAVTLGETTLPADADGVVILPNTLPGTYSITAEADLHCPNTDEVVISPRPIHVTLVALQEGVPNPDDPELCDPIAVEEGEVDGEGMPEGEEMEPADLADAILDRWATLDSDNNGTLSYSEVTAGLDLPASLLPKVDQNLDGTISIGELQLLLTAASPIHSADTNGSRRIDLSELLRILQLHAAGGYDCATNAAQSEDGYLLAGLGTSASTCRPHASDYRDGANGLIDLTETLRAIQLYNFGAIASCPGNFEDDFCAVNK